MSKGLSECSPLCESFRCTKGRDTLRVRTRGGKKEAWCNAFEDVCDGAWCQYSKCEMKRMLDAGKCKGREKPSFNLASDPERLLNGFEQICEEAARKSQLVECCCGFPRNLYKQCVSVRSYLKVD